MLEHGVVVQIVFCLAKSVHPGEQRNIFSGSVEHEWLTAAYVRSAIRKQKKVFRVVADAKRPVGNFVLID